MKKEDCSKLVSHLSEYLDGDIDESLCKCFDEHLKDCPECARQLETLKDCLHMMETAPDEALSEGARARAVQALKALRADKPGQ